MSDADPSSDCRRLAKTRVAGRIGGHDPAATGEALIAALQASPHREIEIEPERWPMPVRRILPLSSSS